MKIIPVEEETFHKMKLHFSKFVSEIESICGSATKSNKWLDNQEVCMLLKISKRTLQYYRDNNLLPFSRIGNKCYYKITDIEKMVSNSENRNI